MLVIDHMESAGVDVSLEGGGYGQSSMPIATGVPIPYAWLETGWAGNVSAVDPGRWTAQRVMSESCREASLGSATKFPGSNGQHPPKRSLLASQPAPMHRPAACAGGSQGPSSRVERDFADRDCKI